MPEREHQSERARVKTPESDSLSEIMPERERQSEKGSAGGCVGGDEAATLFRGCGVHRTDTAKVLEQWVETTREVRVFGLLRARLFAFCALSASEPTYVGRGETMATRACSLMPIEVDEETDGWKTEKGTVVWGDNMEAETATKLEPLSH